MKTKLKLKNTKLYIIITVMFALSLMIHEIKIQYIAAHISNFAITGFMLCLSLGYDLYKGTLSKRSLFFAMGFWALINIVMEYFVQLQTLNLPGVSFIDFNTPDPIDAMFGLAAILLYYFAGIRFCSVKT